MTDNTFIRSATWIAVVALVALSPLAHAGVKAKLTGFQEVPSVSTDATGRFKAKLDRRDNVLEFRLSYAGIETFVRFAHIHFNQRHDNGGIIVWLCDNTGGSPTAVDPCPQGAGTVEGIITADDVVGPAGQGIAAGEFDEVIEAINARATYVNVHSDTFPGGEIRGQIRGSLGRGDRHRDEEDEDDED